MLEIGTTENIKEKLATASEVIDRVMSKHGSEVEGSINLKYLVDNNTETYFTQESILDFDIIPETDANNENPTETQ